MDLTPVDPLLWVTGNPQMFFIGGRPTPSGLLSWLTADVLHAGAEAVVKRLTSNWWMVGSTADWLVPNHYNLSDVELFTRVVAEPSRDPFPMRGEVVVNAYASATCTVVDGKTSAVKGELPPIEVLEKSAGSRRAVLFDLEES